MWSKSTKDWWRKVMVTNHNIDAAKSYQEEMLRAVYGVIIISGSASVWLIDQVNECAKKLKETEINHV